MEAKAYLQRVKALNEMILNKSWEVKRLKIAAQGMTSFSETVTINGVEMGMDKVQSSGNPQRMADAVCSYVDIERRMETEMIGWEREKLEIISTIQTLPMLQYTVLHRIYVQEKSLQDVADEFNRSKSWAKGVHGRAIKSVQSILDARAAADSA